MFETLAKERVNIQMISTSEIKISRVVDIKIRGTRGQGAFTTCSNSGKEEVEERGEGSLSICPIKRRIRYSIRHHSP